MKKCHFAYRRAAALLSSTLLLVVLLLPCFVQPAAAAEGEEEPDEVFDEDYDEDYEGDYEEDYGISLLDFWEEDSSVEASASAPSAGSVLFAAGYGKSYISSFGVSSLTNAWQTKTNSIVLTSWNGTKARATAVFARWGSGVALDVSMPVSFASPSVLVTVSGKMVFDVYSSFYGDFVDSYDDTYSATKTHSWSDITNSLSVYLLVNGEPTGSALADEDAFTYQISAGDYDGGIYSLGWRFVNETGAALDCYYTPSDSFAFLYSTDLQLIFTGEFITVSSEASYDGFFKTIIQWLANIKDSIVSLPSRIADFVISGIRGLFDDEFAEAEEDAQDFSAVGDELANYGFAEFDGNRTESELQLLFGDNPFMKVVGYVICIGFVGMILKKAVG